MVYVQTKVNVVNVPLFTKSHTNAAEIYELEILKRTKKIEQHFQDSPQKVIHDKNADYFATHSAKNFTQKPSPQQYRKIISFEIFSTVKPIG